MPERVAALVGPTAAGKTELSLRLAAALDAEIVSVDSMQIYKGMDIGTAKPTGEQQARVPHHLLDLFEPSHDLSVAEFQRLARDAIDDITGRDRLPLLVGGSGLYFRAVVDDLDFPPRSTEVRARLEEEADELGSEELHRRLAELDPDAAARVEPANARRIVRALEVIAITGRRFSDASAWEKFDSRYELAVAGLTRSRPELYRHIAERVDAMLEAGLIGEARELAERGLGRTARQALGYRQVLDAIPEMELGELREQIVSATKRYARRQESWFRADPRVVWFDAGDSGLEENLQAFLKGYG